jgi:hypothetical protein
VLCYRCVAVHSQSFNVSSCLFYFKQSMELFVKIEILKISTDFTAQVLDKDAEKSKETKPTARINSATRQFGAPSRDKTQLRL